MSRGLGKVQRRVVEVLSENGSCDLQHLAELVFDTPSPTASQIRSVRRALAKLCEANKVRSVRRSANEHARALGLPTTYSSEWVLVIQD